MQQTYIGPTTETEKYNGSLLKFITDSQRYTSNLSLFRKYILWRYTIGSGAINSRLIFQKDSDNSTYWVFLFLKYFKSTVQQTDPNANVRNSDLLPKFRPYLEYFNEPRKLMIAPEYLKAKIVSNIIGHYINELQSILQSGPLVQGTGFRVFKVSSAYPGLPTPGPDFQPTAVVQIPFNSTTISSDFNFAPFIAPTGTSYLWSIFIPPGTRGPLFVDSDLHAYSSFEHEILLPYGVTFNVLGYYNVILKYIDPKDVNIKQIQQKDKISMGNVYDLSEYEPTKGLVKIQERPFVIFDTVLR
jgi:hypothetical protein